MGHIILETICDEGFDAKTIEVSYLIVDAISPYNIIVGQSVINTMGTVVSTM